MLQGKNILFFKVLFFTFLWGLKMCVLWTNLWGPFRGPHYDGLVSKNYPFKRTFWVGSQKCPHNLNRPHFAGVCSYECPRKYAAVSTHTHTYTIQLSNTCRAYSILIVKQLYKKRSFNKKQCFYAVTPSLVTSNGCGTSMAPLWVISTLWTGWLTASVLTFSIFFTTSYIYEKS